MNFFFLPPSHNGVAIAKKIRFLLKDWGFAKKVTCLTVDNASSNDSCFNKLKSLLKLVCDGDCFHVHFCTHVLNLIVRKGLKNVDEVVFKVGSVLTIARVPNVENKDFLSRQDM